MSQLIDNLNTIYAEKQEKIKPENIKDGVKIFDVVGTYKSLDTSDATATANDIAKDKTAYINGEKVVGTYVPEEFIFDEKTNIGYTKLEYIESTGTQYIDTGIIPSNHTVEMQFQYTVANNDTALFGEDSFRYHLTWYNNMWYYYCGGTDEYNVEATNCTELQTVIFNNANNQIEFNGVEVGSTNDGTSKASTNLYLFCRRWGGDANRHSSARIHYCKIYDKNNGVLVRHFIPVRSNISGELGMFDIITQEFYKNKGTDKFVAGPEILPKDTSDFEENYQRVEFIQSNARQYIKTGVKPTAGVHSAWVDFEVVQVVANKEAWILGQWYNNGWRCGGTGSSDGTTMNFDATRGFTYTSQTVQTRIQGFSEASTITAPYEMTLFGQMENGSVRYYDYGYFKLYGCKIWENGVLIRDYVPCYRKSDNRPGIYDLVNNKFSVNGSSYAYDFTKGPDVTVGNSAYVLSGLTHYFRLDGNLNESIFNTKVLNYGTQLDTDSTIMQGCCDTSNGYALFDTTNVSKTTFSLSVLAKAYATNTGENHMLVSLCGPGPADNISTSADTACALKISNGALSVDFCHSAMSSNIRPSGDGNWHRYTVTYDGSAVKLYDNDRLVGTQTKTLKIDANAFGIIGNWLPSWTMFFQGLLANLLIYNRALTEDEIIYNYAQDSALANEV